MPNIQSFKSHQEYLDWYKIYREKNRKKLRKYNCEYNSHYRKQHGYFWENRWKNKNKEKCRIHSQLARAVKNGRIKREPCEVCGAEISVAHHPDYSKPLIIVWLCKIHHRKVHYSLCG